MINNIMIFIAGTNKHNNTKTMAYWHIKIISSFISTHTGLNGSTGDADAFAHNTETHINGDAHDTETHIIPQHIRNH